MSDIDKQPPIDRVASTRWAIAYVGSTVGRSWFDLVSLNTYRVHSLHYWSEAGVGTLNMGVPSSRISGCPNFFEFTTSERKTFDSFDGTYGTLETTSLTFRKWLELSIIFLPKKESSSVKMADWGGSLPGANASAGWLTVAYGSGISECIELVPPPILRDRYEIMTRLHLTQQEDKFCLSIPGDLLFDFDKDAIKTEAAPTLKEVADAIRGNPKRRVMIDGHTDSIGTSEYNQKLSDRRARAVANWLTDPAKGKVKASDMIVQGWGKERPKAGTQPSDDRSAPDSKANRRVEICLTPR